MAMIKYYIGIDVGTGSVRSALISHDGELVSSSTHPIKTFRSATDHRIFEQSTDDIWAAICVAVNSVLSESPDVSRESVKGIGFDATCSLAVTDFDGRPVVVTKGEHIGKVGFKSDIDGDVRNIILWADHRAEEEAKHINNSGSIVLDYVGGTMSLEMEIPKILWLKHNTPPNLFSQCQFFDLPDYLTYRCTSSAIRSSCSLTCKCSFIPSPPSGASGLSKKKKKKGGWQDSFFETIGLGDFVMNGYKQIGAGKKTRNDDDDGEDDGEDKVLTAGLPVGKGLTKKAADELGLVEGTPVGSGVIDAYAGWIGTIGARYRIDSASSPNSNPSPFPSLDESRYRLAAVAGTSTCHLVQSPEGIYVKGVWGPYKDAVFPGWWMNEGGQSSTGQLIDHMITTHTVYPKLRDRAKEEGRDVHDILLETLETLRLEGNVQTFTELTKDLHLYPDLHGNRSPIADPRMRGSITGLTLDSSVNDLSLKLHVTLQSICLQTRHIIDTLNSSGHAIKAIYMSGGQTKNKMLMQMLADVCELDVVLPCERIQKDAVTFGAALLGRFACEATDAVELLRLEERKEEDLRGKLWEIMVEMTPPGSLITPKASIRERSLLNAKYKIFLENIELQKRWRKEMEDALVI